MADTLAAIEAAFTELSADAGSEPAQSEHQTETEPQATETPTPETPAAPATPGQETEPKPVASAQPQDEVPLTGNLPVARHKAILDKTRKEYEERLAKLSWAERYASDPEIKERLEAFELAEKSPLEFLARYEQVLAQDERYASYLAARRASQPAQKPEQQKPAEDPRPEPDVDLEDGRRLYSAEQMQKLLDWQDRRIADRYKPLVEKDERAERYNRAYQENISRLNEARTWEGWKENEAAIAEYMAKDKRTTLESAYRAVVIPKLKADRAALEAEMRSRIVAEMNSNAKASTEVPGRAATGTPKSYKGMSTADIVAETFRELAG